MAISGTRFVLGLFILTWCQVTVASDGSEQQAEIEQNNTTENQSHPDNLPSPIIIQNIEPNTSNDNEPSKTTERYQNEDLVAQRRMAEAAEKTVDVLWIEIYLLPAIIVIALASAIISYRALKQGREANQTTRNALETQNRPWVSIEPKIASDLTWEDDGRARLTISFELENVGKTPAVNVRVFAELAITKFYKDNPEERHKAFRETAREKSDALFTRTLFPWQKIPVGQTFGLLKEDIDDFKEWHKNRSGGKDANFICIVLYGCAQYTTSDSSIPKQTPFFYDLIPVDRTDNSVHPVKNHLIWIDRGNIPADDLALSVSFLGLGSPE